MLNGTLCYTNVIRNIIPQKNHILSSTRLLIWTYERNTTKLHAPNFKVRHLGCVMYIHIYISSSSSCSLRVRCVPCPLVLKVELVLSPCDFDLIPKMKEPLRGIRFRTVPEILQAVDRSIRTINTIDVAKGILRLPHRWQRVVHNAGDYIEGQ